MHSVPKPSSRGKLRRNHSAVFALLFFTGKELPFLPCHFILKWKVESIKNYLIRPPGEGEDLGIPGFDPAPLRVLHEKPSADHGNRKTEPEPVAAGFAPLLVADETEPVFVLMLPEPGRCCGYILIP
jgi:hypothetical protein